MTINTTFKDIRLNLLSNLMIKCKEFEFLHAGKRGTYIALHMTLV